MDRRPGKPYILGVDDEPSLGYLYSKIIPTRVEASSVHFLLVESQTHPDLQTLMVEVNARIAQAIADGYSPLVVVDNSLGINISGQGVLSGLDPSIPAVVAAAVKKKELRDYYGAGVESGQIVGFYEKGTHINGLISVIQRHFYPYIEPIKIEELNPENSFKTLPETLLALKAFAAAPNDLRKGKDIFEKALGFINGHLSVSTGLAKDEKELRYKTHAVRGLLGSLLIFAEHMADSGSLQTETNMSRCLNFVIAILEGRSEGDEINRAESASLTDLLEEFKNIRALVGKDKLSQFPVIEWSDLPTLDPSIDRAALRLLLSNLLGNATANPKIQTVEFSGWRTNTATLILIDDDGPALPNGFFNAIESDEVGKTGNGARHMQAIAAEQGWILSDGSALGAKFLLKIPKAS